MQPRTLEFIRGLREFESMGWRAGWSVRELATRLRRTWRESNRREMVNYFLSALREERTRAYPVIESGSLRMDLVAARA